ncbi:hypothetical protein HPO96_34400 [Kribbella sandramycini]|uniref:Uncharacterized protein n=1 Tax=Kribbella sandramycini TaxID=60450 RepID=A0A7Y4P302_9ACTN|nr:SitI3 family protein [Kribbella sandramycini]MBB6570147.1 hypothetical protein [Kribbella sandramycini]NOL45351.1 hypothetical protein [Kribbella sandramycini]
MAIEYSLHLCTPTHPQVISWLIAPDVWYLTHHRTATRLLITVHPESSPNLVLGESDVSVGFRLDKVADPEPQYAEIVSIVVRILTAEPGDAMLQQDYERIQLLRRGADLQLSDSWYWWKPELLALIPWPYTRRDLPYPED